MIFCFEVVVNHIRCILGQNVSGAACIYREASPPGSPGDRTLAGRVAILVAWMVGSSLILMHMGIEWHTHSTTCSLPL